MFMRCKKNVYIYNIYIYTYFLENFQPHIEPLFRPSNSKNFFSPFCSHGCHLKHRWPRWSGFKVRHIQLVEEMMNPGCFFNFHMCPHLNSNRLNRYKQIIFKRLFKQQRWCMFSSKCENCLLFLDQSKSKVLLIVAL